MAKEKPIEQVNEYWRGYEDGSEHEARINKEEKETVIRRLAAWRLCWLGIFILLILMNHITKCTDTLYYDISLIGLILLAVVR